GAGCGDNRCSILRGNIVDDGSLRPVLQIATLSHARIAIDCSSAGTAIRFYIDQRIEGAADIIEQARSQTSDSTAAGGSYWLISQPACAAWIVAKFVECRRITRH